MTHRVSVLAPCGARAASVGRVVVLSFGCLAAASHLSRVDAAELSLIGAGDCFALFGAPNGPGGLAPGRGNGNGNGNRGSGNGNGDSGSGNGNGNIGNNNGNWNSVNCVGNFYRSDGNDNGIFRRFWRPRHMPLPQD